MKLSDLKNKKILIMGYGLEGQSTEKVLKQLSPSQNFAIADQKLSKNYLSNLSNYQLVIKSPGISPFSPEILKAKKNGVVFTSQTQLFFDNCQNMVIGITGTKGKSTTASLTYEILKAGGLPVKLIGNIGQPCLPFLLTAQKKEIFVFELSSHQLFDIKRSPQIAVFLNLYREHLDYYPNMEKYLWAKENITRFQKESDYFIYNSDFESLRLMTSRSKAKKISFGKSYNLPIKEFLLQGEHNRLNIMPAYIIGKLLKVPLPVIKETIKSFQPLEHRLEKVGVFKGIIFINDSISTIPESTIAALDALGNKVETLILGGFERNQDFRKLIDKINNLNYLKNIILFPVTGTRIAKLLHKKYFLVKEMKKAVQIAYQNTTYGSICLLSPAAPSFGIFKDYLDRGNQFKKYAHELH